jgi:hypothetical protein
MIAERFGATEAAQTLREWQHGTTCDDELVVTIIMKIIIYKKDNDDSIKNIIERTDENNFDRSIVKMLTEDQPCYAH